MYHCCCFSSTWSTFYNYGFAIIKIIRHDSRLYGVYYMTVAHLTLFPDINGNVLQVFLLLCQYPIFLLQLFYGVSNLCTFLGRFLIFSLFLKFTYSSLNFSNIIPILPQSIEKLPDISVLIFYVMSCYSYRLILQVRLILQKDVMLLDSLNSINDSMRKRSSYFTFLHFYSNIGILRNKSSKHTKRRILSGMIQPTSKPESFSTIIIQAMNPCNWSNTSTNSCTSTSIQGFHDIN